MITQQKSIKTLIIISRLQAQLPLTNSILNNPAKLNLKTGLRKTISRIILDFSNQPSMWAVVCCKSRNVLAAQPINLDQQPKQSNIRAVLARVQMLLEVIKNTTKSTLWIKETRGTQLIHMLMIIYLKHMAPRPKIQGRIRTIQVSTVITIQTVVVKMYTIIPRESLHQVKNLTSTALIRMLEFLVLFRNPLQKKSILIQKKLARFLTQTSGKKNHHRS